MRFRGKWFPDNDLYLQFAVTKNKPKKLLKKVFPNDNSNASVGIGNQLEYIVKYTVRKIDLYYFRLFTNEVKITIATNFSTILITF